MTMHQMQTLAEGPTRAPMGAIGERLTDELLWKHRHRSTREWAARTGFLEDSINRHMLRRGWRRDVKDARTPISHAPCSKCGRTRALIDLSSDRLCLGCETDPVRKLVRKEMKAFLRRNPQYRSQRPR